MNQKVYLEHIQRVGIVTLEDLCQQVGETQTELLAQPLISLLEEKHVFYSSLVHGKKTFHSRPFMFCLQTLRPDPQLSEQAQDVYDTLYDNEESSLEELLALVTDPLESFSDAVDELQQQCQITPHLPIDPKMRKETYFEATSVPEKSFCWITAEAWYRDLHRSPRYRDLEYCFSEVKNGMRRYFSTREINEFLYAYK